MEQVKVKLKYANAAFTIHGQRLATAKAFAIVPYDDYTKEVIKHGVLELVEVIKDAEVIVSDQPKRGRKPKE